MDSERHKWTYEEISEIARQSAIRSHLCGCVIVLFVLWYKAGRFEILGVAVVEMILFATIPLIIAAVTTEVVNALSLRYVLPIPLFVRSCVMLVELTLLGWLLILMDRSFFPVRP